MSSSPSVSRFLSSCFHSSLTFSSHCSSTQSPSAEIVGVTTNDSASLSLAMFCRSTLSLLFDASVHLKLTTSSSFRSPSQELPSRSSSVPRRRSYGLRRRQRYRLDVRRITRRREGEQDEEVAQSWISEEDRFSQAEEGGFLGEG